MRYSLLLIILIISQLALTQSVSLNINSITGNTINVSPSITAGTMPIFLGNLTLRFNVIGNTSPLSSFTRTASSTLQSTTGQNVTVTLSPQLSGNQLLLNYQPSCSPDEQLLFDECVVRIPANGSATLGSFNILFSGIPNGTITCGVQNVQGFQNTTPWNQTQISPSCDVNLSILPITLHTFSATKERERSARLDWTTTSEINSDYFGIERSRDGQVWDAIGKVAAAGNSSESLSYTYLDDQLPMSRTADQIFYYRLKLTDLDGSHKYSDIKAVNFSRKTSDGISIYPNPAMQMVHLDISSLDVSAGEIDLRISDMYGRIMLDKAIIGTGIEPVDVTQYPAGTYNVSVTQGENQHHKRFIKVD